MTIVTTVVGKVMHSRCDCVNQDLVALQTITNDVDENYLHACAY